MLQPADVLNIKCKFVERVLNFLKKQKRQVGVCYTELLPYFADAQLASTLYDEECLSVEDECSLTKKANKYGNQPELNPGITPCDSQVTLALSSSASACSTSGVVENASGLAFPRIVLTNDSIYHDAVLDVKITDCDSSVQTEQIRVGCTGVPEVCTNSNRVAADMAFVLSYPPSVYPGGYIQTLRVYQTDSNGILVNSPIDLDVSPGNVAAWNACGTCSAVNGADLYFSSLNYKTAWETLMLNVSKTLFGGTYLDAKVLWNSSGSPWIYTFKIKHNPASIWMGPNKNNFVVLIFNGSSFVPFTNLQTLVQGSFLHQELDFDVSCGTVTATADSFAGSGANTTPNTNFNFLQFATQDITSLPITLSLSGDTSCNLVTLTATYTTTQTIDSVSWTDPLDAEISDTNIAIINAEDTGEYTFTITLENGCVISDTITI